MKHTVNKTFVVLRRKKTSHPEKKLDSFPLGFSCKKLDFFECFWLLIGKNFNLEMGSNI
jgi:hypothetical protein